MKRITRSLTVLAFPGWLAAAATTVAQPVWSPVAGDDAGGESTLACPASDQVIAAVRGRVDLSLESIDIACVRVSAAGRWVGDPEIVGAVGEGDAGTPFARSCPRDQVVAGISGMAGRGVHVLTLRCRTLEPGGGTDVRVRILQPIGQPGGRGFGPLDCPDGRSARAFRVRSHDRLIGLAVGCQLPLPRAPKLLAPTEGSTLTQARVIPAFSWLAEPLASYYEICLARGASCDPDGSAAVTARVEGTAFAPMRALPFTPGLVTWEVRACSGNGCGAPGRGSFRLAPR